MNGLESYLSIMNMIEKMVERIDLKKMSVKVIQLHSQSNDYEKRFYFIENRVKIVNEILARKIKMLEKEK